MSSVTTAELEERLAMLEDDVARLKLAARHSALSQKQWWRDLLGKYEHNSDFDEAMRLGREYRESQREHE
ncbi:MAG: hypothetical protein H0T45_16025 [Pyrinomonadaceae bacterium]|nr:hypothetical protein [Pyrinomonadaceae bacterium]